MTLMFSRTSEAQGGSQGGQGGSAPVRVVNTPLPVTVTNPSDGAKSNLGPTKASDLVTLTASGAACQSGAHPALQRFDQQSNGDGTTTPVAIPSGSVLVVTGFDFRQGITGGAGQQEELFLIASSLSTNSLSLIADLMAAPGSSDSRAGLSAAITGVTIKSTAVVLLAGQQPEHRFRPARCFTAISHRICETHASLKGHQLGFSDLLFDIQQALRERGLFRVRSVRISPHCSSGKRPRERYSRRVRN
jgi:hypothetical protein